MVCALTFWEKMRKKTVDYCDILSWIFNCTEAIIVGG